MQVKSHSAVVQKVPVHSSKEREGNYLVNDALSSFYVSVMFASDMVKDHSNTERRIPLPPLH